MSAMLHQYIQTPASKPAQANKGGEGLGLSDMHLKCKQQSRFIHKLLMHMHTSQLTSVVSGRLSPCIWLPIEWLVWGLLTRWIVHLNWSHLAFPLAPFAFNPNPMAESHLSRFLPNSDLEMWMGTREARSSCQIVGSSTANCACADNTTPFVEA